MARCIRCNKFMLMKSQTGYCNDCYDDYDYNDEDDTDYYDYEQMQREAWNETHMNPYGTEDCGDGYIDSDGVFTEY